MSTAKAKGNGYGPIDNEVWGTTRGEMLKQKRIAAGVSRRGILAALKVLCKSDEDVIGDSRLSEIERGFNVKDKKQTVTAPTRQVANALATFFSPEYAADRARFAKEYPIVSGGGGFRQRDPADTAKLADMLAS